VRDYGFKTVGYCVRMMELYASCRQVRTPLRRLCLRVLEKLPLLRDRFFAGLLTVGADRPWESGISCAGIVHGPNTYASPDYTPGRWLRHTSFKGLRESADPARIQLPECP
jgi:hypothetical protein